MTGFRPLAAALLSVFMLAVSSTPVRPFGFSDLALGEPVATLIKSHGSPNVVTTDVGQIWTWDSDAGEVRVTSDDDGIVQLFDILPSTRGPVSFALPSTPPLLLNFGLMTVPEAETHFASLQAFAANATFPDNGEKADVRGYNVGPATLAILLFGQGTKTLGEAFYGYHDYLAHAGVVPGGTDPAQVAFTAPVLIHHGSSDYPPTKNQGDAFVRVSVDAAGKVSTAKILSTSGDIDLDRAAISTAMSYTFKPATRNGVAVASVFFHKEIFRTLPPKV